MRDKATLAPPDVALTWQQSFPGTPDQLRQVRAALRAFLDGCPATGDIALLVTELAANAIAHSASGRPGGTFTVRVRHAYGEYVRAGVRDAGSDWHGDIARSASRPHGLYLVLALASACGAEGGGSRHRVVPAGGSCRDGVAVRLTRDQLDRIMRLGEQWSLLWDKRRRLWIAAEDARDGEQIEEVDLDVLLDRVDRLTGPG